MAYSSFKYNDFSITSNKTRSIHHIGLDPNTLMPSKHLYRSFWAICLTATCLHAETLQLKSNLLIYDESLKRLDASGDVQLILNNTTINGEKLS